MKEITEIQTLADIQRLVTQPDTDWSRYGEVRTETAGDLIIFNYTAKAQYEARWNFFERVSRGLIFNRVTGEVVARAFDKMYNWMEGGRHSTASIVSVTEKVDGSLGILYRVPQDDGIESSIEYRVSTRGSLVSDQGIWATEFLNRTYDLTGLPNELTLLLEIIYPENRIVLDYGDREDLVLLAARNRFTGDFFSFAKVAELAERYGFALPRVYEFANIEEIIQQQSVIDTTEEGWVVEFADGSRFKFKGHDYVELHKLIYGLNFKVILDAVAESRVDAIFNSIPDEFLDQAKGWVAEIEQIVAQTQKAIEDAFAAAPKATRKEFAIWVQQHHKKLAPYLFAMLDDQEVTPMIYKTVFKGYEPEQSNR